MPVTPFVFISHAGADKPRIRPLVEALMAADLKVWIDFPDRMGFTKDEVTRVLRIRAGGRWEDEIDEANREAACILVCWSRLALHESVLDGKSRRTWMGEVEYGRKERKLVACTVDDVKPTDLPDTHASQQMPCVDPDQPPVKREAAMRILVDDVKRVMQRRSREALLTRRTVARRTSEPYLADRAEQQACAEDAIRKMAGAGGVHPIFIASPENERPDEFRSRIDDLSAELLVEDKGWYALAIAWPTGLAPAAFATAYRRNLCLQLGRSSAAGDAEIAAAMEELGQPVAAFHRISAYEWERDETARVESCLAFWRRLHVLSPRLKVLLWLQLKMRPAKPGWKECPPGPSAGRVGNLEIWRSIVRLRDKLAEAGSPVGLVVPPVLAPIVWSDADRWVDEMRTSDHVADGQRLEEEVRKLYPETGYLGGLFRGQPRRFGVCHQQFAQALEPLFERS